MTKQEILKGNRLIAEYMSKGFSMSHISDYKNCADDELPKMKYHTSWDWLMPVVEKIIAFQYSDAESHQDTAWPRTFGMPAVDGGYMVRFNRCPVFTAKTLKEATYNAIIDFIQKNRHEKNNS